METYGYKQQKINELNNIDNNSNNFYIYNGLNFLSKLNSKNENIIIGVQVKIPYAEPHNVFPKWGCVKNFKKANKAGLLATVSNPFFNNGSEYVAASSKPTCTS